MIEAYLRANNMFVDYSEVGLNACCDIGFFSENLVFSDYSVYVLSNCQPQQERVYSSNLQLDLSDVEPCISGPKRFLYQELCASIYLY